MLRMLAIICNWFIIFLLLIGLGEASKDNTTMLGIMMILVLCIVNLVYIYSSIQKEK